MKENKGTQRDTVLVGDQDVIYSYGRGRGEETVPKSWPDVLIDLKERIENFLNTKFDICLCVRNLLSIWQNYLRIHFKSFRDCILTDQRGLASIQIEKNLERTPQLHLSVWELNESLNIVQKRHKTKTIIRSLYIMEVCW